MGFNQLLRKSLADYKANLVLIVPALVSTIASYAVTAYYSPILVGAAASTSPHAMLSRMGWVFGFEFILLFVGFLILLGQVSMTGKVISAGKTRVSDWWVGVRKYCWRVLGVGTVFGAVIIAVSVVGTIVWVFLFLLPSISQSGPSSPPAAFAFGQRPIFSVAFALLGAIGVSIFVMCLAPIVLDSNGVWGSITSGFKAMRKSGIIFLEFLGLVFLLSLPSTFLGFRLIPNLSSFQSFAGNPAFLLSEIIGTLVSPLFYLMGFRIYNESRMPETFIMGDSSAMTNLKSCQSCNARIPADARYCPSCGTSQP